MINIWNIAILEKIYKEDLEVKNKFEEYRRFNNYKLYNKYTNMMSMIKWKNSTLW